MNWDGLLSFFLTVCMSAGISLLGFLVLLPTKLGEKYLGHHFEARLEKIKADLKLENAKELGAMQADLDHLKDRGVRSNEREYQAITAAWEAFVDAFQATRRAVVQFMSHPDLAFMEEDDIRDFLQHEDITGRLAEHIIGSENRNQAYARVHRSKKISDANNAIVSLFGLLDKQSVFIPKQLYDQLLEATKKLNSARLEQYMAQNRVGGGPLKLDDSMDVVGAEGDKMMLELREAARGRLLTTMSDAGTVSKP